MLLGMFVLIICDVGLSYCMYDGVFGNVGLWL